MTKALLQLVLSAAERHDQQAADRAAARARLAVMLSDTRTVGGRLLLAAVVLMGGCLLGFVAMVALAGVGR